MLTDITIDRQRVSIPVELFGDGEGMAVLTLARGAYLIIRSDLLATYPRKQLMEFCRMAQTLEQLPPNANGAFTPRKRRALRELRQQGYPVSDGSEYGLRAMGKPEINLEQVWEELSTMAGSLSHEVLAEREER